MYIVISYTISSVELWIISFNKNFEQPTDRATHHLLYFARAITLLTVKYINHSRNSEISSTYNCIYEIIIQT